LKDYTAANDAFLSEPVPIPGTFAAVIDAYLNSPEFGDLAVSTKKNYRIYIKRICPVFGGASIHAIKRKHIKGFRNKIQGRAAANQVVRVFGAIMAWAIDNDIIEVNPTRDIKMFRGGEYKPWPDPLVEKFFSEAPPHLVWPVAMGLWTGQRRGDVLAARWADIEDGTIHFVQQKTGAEVWVPILPALDAVLSTIPRRSLYILTTRRGLPWTPKGFTEVFGRYMRGIGAGGYVFHGLRKNFSVMAAEAGATVDELKSVTGHKSDAMAAHYTRRANRKRLAKSAILKIRGVNDD
jgi:integrase